ncbi:MAG: hypothetical protein K0Q73_6168 [Paenibacillus sp.]|nr:hypothetical protein [Paenibacillus sp.]
MILLEKRLRADAGMCCHTCPHCSVLGLTTLYRLFAAQQGAAFPQLALEFADRDATRLALMLDSESRCRTRGLPRRHTTGGRPGGGQRLMGGGDAAASDKQIGDLLWQQAAVRNVIGAVTLHPCGCYPFAGRIVNIDRVAASGDTVVESPAADHILRLQDILSIDSARFPDADLGADGGERSALETGQLTDHKVGDHSYLLASKHFRFRQIGDIGAVKPLYASRIDQHLVLSRSGKKQNLIAVDGQIGRLPMAEEAKHTGQRQVRKLVHGRFFVKLIGMADHILLDSPQIDAAHSELHGHRLGQLISVASLQARRTGQMGQIGVAACEYHLRWIGFPEEWDHGCECFCSVSTFV